jgi:LysR family hydrogen peroxide-inducible transcriptional activator
MGMSTPAASQIVHRLERDLDVSLFERTAGGLRLTPAGLLLREKARTLIDSESDVLHELRTYRGKLIPTLRLYMMDSIAIHLMNALLPDLMAAVTRVEVLSGRSLTRGRDFLTGEIDLLITSEEFDDIPTVEDHVLCRQGLVAVLPSSVPEEERTPEILARRLPLIRFREGAVIDRDVTTYLQGRSLDLPRTIECGSPATMLQIIAGGHGWVIAPPLVVSWFQPHMEGLAWCALPPPTVNHDLRLVAHADKLLDLPSVLARSCRAALRNEIESWRGTAAEACIAATVVMGD